MYDSSSYRCRAEWRLRSHNARPEVVWLPGLVFAVWLTAACTPSAGPGSPVEDSGGETAVVRSGDAEPLAVPECVEGKPDGQRSGRARMPAPFPCESPGAPTRSDAGGCEASDSDGFERLGVDPCNGRDDDCDGRTDEDCCDRYETPRGVRIGGASALEVAPSVAGAPEGASYVAAHLKETGDGHLHLRHYRPTGETAGGTAELAFDDARLEALALQPVDEGYGIAIEVRPGDGNSRLDVLHVNAALTGHRKIATVERVPADPTDGVDALGRLEAAPAGTHLWLTYVRETAPGRHRIRAASVDIPRKKLATDPITIDRPNPRTTGGWPEIALIDGVPTVAYLQYRPPRIRGVRVRDGRVTSRFRGPVEHLIRGSARRSLRLFSVAGTAHLTLLDSDRDEGRSVLRIWRLPGAPRGDIGTGMAAAVAGTPLAAAVRPVHTGRNDRAEHLLALWLDDSERTIARVDRLALRRPDRLAGRKLTDVPAIPDGGARLSLTGSGRVVAARTGRKVVPETAAGRPICPSE